MPEHMSDALCALTSWDKKSARLHGKKVRNSMDADMILVKSETIKERVLELEQVAGASVVCTYASTAGEVQTFSLIEALLAAEKKVYVPLVSGKDMDFYRIESLDDLKEGFHGILEPVGQSEKYMQDGTGAVMLLPGLAFDKKLNRVGYGGGYYDRYLAMRNAFFKVALSFSEQLLNTIEVEPTDQPVDIIVTDEGIFT